MIRRSIQYTIIGHILVSAGLAQLSAPNVEAVYGGRINDIAGYVKSSGSSGDTSRIFIATESANTLFYADIHSQPGPPSFGTFSTVPGVDADNGFGDGVQDITVHGTSGKVFFIFNNQIISGHPELSTTDTLYSGFGLNGLEVFGDTLFFVEDQQLYFGSLDTAGNYSNLAGSPISIGAANFRASIHVNPRTDTLYIFMSGNNPRLFRASDSYDNVSGATTFSDISPAGLSTSLEWRAFGIAPDGRLFVAGSDNTGKRIAYSDDETIWTEYSTGMNGGSGQNICFSGDSAAYYVYSSSIYNDNNGLSGSWMGFGWNGQETHPNDGVVCVDPVNESIVYMTTDQGLGASINNGEIIFEINDGIEAVQVSDFDQRADKQTGWVASKSGVRRVKNYLTSPTWTNALFPMGDGSPYYSVETDPSDTLIVYAGNVRIYQSKDEGMSWSRIFTPEDAPYSFSGVGTKALALEVCDYDSNIVFAGFEVQGSDKGGVFYSHNRGTTWDQLLIEATATGYDVDISDIIFNVEGTDTVAYFGAQYDLSSPRGYGVYRAVKSGAIWTVSQDMGATGTSAGYAYVASIWDLVLSTTKDTVFAAGTDAGNNHAVAYYKPLNSTGLWTPFGTSGFPMNGVEATAITVGRDTVYVAIDNDIYYFDIAASLWTLGYSYPRGTRINVLFYDDLLVGCDFGLYGHTTENTVVSVDNERAGLTPETPVLIQNYPNPFNAQTMIQFYIPQSDRVTLTIFNLKGQVVESVINGNISKGYHEIRVDMSQYTSSVYIYQLKTSNTVLNRKLVYVR